MFTCYMLRTTAMTVYIYPLMFWNAITYWQMRVSCSCSCHPVEGVPLSDALKLLLLLQIYFRNIVWKASGQPNCVDKKSVKNFLIYVNVKSVWERWLAVWSWARIRKPTLYKIAYSINKILTDFFFISYFKECYSSWNRTSK